MDKKRFALRAVVVEDEPRILNNIVKKLQEEVADCTVVGTAMDGTEGLSLVESLRPDIVFTDIKIPGLNGLELAKRLKMKFPGLYVVIISGYSDFSFAQDAIRYGVFNYMLKPLETEQLVDTVEEIRAKLEQTARRAAPLPLSAWNVRSNTGAVDGVVGNGGCRLFLLCFFNLCCDSRDEQLAAFYEKQLSQVDWEKIFRAALPPGTNWLLADEYAANQKNLIAAAGSAPMDTFAVAGRIRALVQAGYPQLRVNICCHEKPAEREEIWLYAKRMRRVLENCVIAGEPQIFLLERCERTEQGELYQSIRLRTQNSAAPLLKSGNLEALRREFRSGFHYALEKRAPQQMLLKIAQMMFRLLEYSLERWDAEQTEAARAEMLRTFSTASEGAELEAAFLQCLDAVLNPSSNGLCPQNSREELLRYVDAHFNTINSVEQVAAVFNYNYTYLSRLFKSITGETMIRYITVRRMEAAKRLFSEQPELGVGDVAELVGFEDQHYFSRAFRAHAGMSPSEYKAALDR